MDRDEGGRGRGRRTRGTFHPRAIVIGQKLSAGDDCGNCRRRLRLFRAVSSRRQSQGLRRLAHASRPKNISADGVAVYFRFKGSAEGLLAAAWKAS